MAQNIQPDIEFQPNIKNLINDIIEEDRKDEELFDNEEFNKKYRNPDGTKKDKSKNKSEPENNNNNNVIALTSFERWKEERRRGR